MYCEYCGNQLSDYSLFCDKCGKPTSKTVQNESTPAEVPKNTDAAVGRTESGDIGAFVVQAKFSPKYLVPSFVSDVFFLILGIIFVSVAGNDRMYQYKDLFSMLGIVFIIFGIAGLIVSVYSVSVNSRVFCAVYENKVIGTFAESRWSMRTVNLELSYNQINSVSRNKAIVTIVANGRTYYAAASDRNMARRVTEAINERIGGTSAHFHTPRY